MLKTAETPMPILNAFRASLRSVVFLLSLVLLLAAAARAQVSEQPQRGFHPGGSFALSDIEKINTVNGNMILNFPLATLPPGRGGLSASINLLYNSKLWDTHVEYVPDLSNQISPQNFLGLSEDGGWRYGTRYDIRIINRNDGVDDPPQYPDPHAIYIWKVQVIFPDGGIHEFRPHGQADYYDDGFFSVYPPACGGGSGPVSYYSSDGTYMRLVFTPCNGWTLSMPDGTRVENPASGGQRVYDRNNNYIEHVYVEDYNNTGMPAGVIRDQLGRSIATQHDSATQEDLIISTGFNNQTLTTRVKWKTITVNRSYKTSCAGCSQTRGGTSTQTLEMPITVVDRITLPAQSGSLTYVFGYNADNTSNPSLGWGEVNSITLPTLAQATYTWKMDSPSGSGVPPPIDWVLKNSPESKTVHYDQEYDGASTPVNEVWQYSIGDGGSSVVAPDGGATSLTFGNTSYQSAGNGLVFTSVGPDGTVVENIWQQNLPFGLNGAVQRNPYVKTAFTSIKNALGQLTLTAIKDFNYDKNGNVTQVKEYDWVSYGSVPRNNGFPSGIPAGAPLKRVTTNTYARPVPDASGTSDCGDCYWYLGAPNVRNAVASNEVSDGYTPSARLELSYDNPITTANVTETRSWDSTKGAYSNQLTAGNSISVSSQYNTYGQPTLVTDARGYQTEFFYGNVGGVVDLYPTQIKTAFQTPVQRTETREYDFYTSLVTRRTDVDNDVSTSTTYDDFGRPLLVKAAEGKPEESRTVAEYSDALRRVIVRSDLNTLGDGKLVAIKHYDQLDRIRLARQLEDAATQSATDETHGIKVQTRYLFSGQNSYVLTSNPYRAVTSSAATGEMTMGWTRVKSDNGGRLIEAETFGGAVLPGPWGSNTSSSGTVTKAYDANQTTVSDQTLRKRRSVVDALGRWVRVDEPHKDTGNLDENGVPIQPTNYGYDALGNLRQVIQGDQQRFFAYSSLSRLIRAHNPEQKVNPNLAFTDPITGNSQWSTAYTYDGGGHPVTRTDARDIITTYNYDPLNRVLSCTYTDGTPAVTYAYDTVPQNGKGRLTSVSSSVSSYSYNGYDAMGRVTGATQSIGGQTYPTTNVGYDLAGHLKTMTYPSGKVVTNSYDAAGRLSTFAGNLGGPQRTYASGIGYSARGTMTWEEYGTTTPLYHKTFYNSRGQMFDKRVSSVNDTWNWNRGRLILYYTDNHVWGGIAPDNNGNVVYAENWIPPTNQSGDEFQMLFADTYTYDKLNRLTGVYGSSLAGGGSWQSQFAQLYSYDRYGNRSINSGGTTGGINNLQTWIDSNNNRLYAPTDQGISDLEQRLIRYDAAGNQKADYYSPNWNGTRTYDGENRIKLATSTGNDTSTYVYDGDGRRIKRIANGTETWQVYGFGGELLAEYAANAAPTNPQKEYGYRDGELLITAAVTTGSGGTAFSFTEDPVVAETTTVKAVHITELRTAVNQARARANLSSATWTDNPLQATVTAIKAAHITELRARLDEARAALGLSAVNYTDPTLISGYQIKAVHVQELRTKTNEALTTGAGTSLDLRWLVADQLGTPRMIFDQTGSMANVSRHDYLPFGEELFAGTGGRTPAHGYTVTDNVRQKFTSKERDSETGLDYFLARYYSSTQGRFTSVDPGNAGAKLGNPQSWNAYAYTFNNPVNYQDPDGMEVKICGTDGQCTDKDTHLSDENFNKWFRDDKSIKLKGGSIYKDGELIGTYRILSIDGAPWSSALIQAGERPYEKAVGAFAIASVLGGVTGGTAYYFATPFLAPTVTTLGLSSATGTGAAVTEVSLASLSIQQLNGMIRGTQKHLLNRLFGQGMEGAQQAIGSGTVPAGLTRQTLMVAREVAQRAIARGIDKGGVQAARLKIIEEALKKVK